MKFPRLELRWRKSDVAKDGDVANNYNWACDYVLVIFPATTSDMRSNVYVEKTGEEKYCAKNVEYILNTSYRGSTAEPYAGDTPFREGCHANWDGTALGIPAYSVYKGKSKLLKANDSSKQSAISRLDGTDPGLKKNRKNWD